MEVIKNNPMEIGINSLYANMMDATNFLLNGAMP